MRMTAVLRIGMAGIWVAVTAVCGLAQDLRTMKSIYEKSAEDIRNGCQPKFEGLQQQYLKSLEAFKAAAVSQGDLVRTKAAIAEIERFRKTKSLPAAPDENEVPEIKGFQTAYVSQFSKLEIDMTAQHGQLTTKYVQALERLQKEKVKALKLDEAEEIRQEREKAQAAIKGFAETLGMLKGPAASNAPLVSASPEPAKGPWKTADMKDLYLVVDLAKGKDADKYPVSYLVDMPKSGWAGEDKTDKLVLRRIEPGKFNMGSPEDEVGHGANEKQHEVTLTKTFFIGVFEVTQKQWERVMGDRPSQFKNADCRGSRPVEGVSYENIRGADNGANWPVANGVDETSFMGQLRAKTGLAFDLPTESQWEYACRAGTDTSLNSGKNLTTKYECPNFAKVGRCKNNSGAGGAKDESADTGTAEVGSYQPNAWGVYDLHGNVWEWCLDWKGDYQGTARDPRGVQTGTERIARGGGFDCRPGGCRSASRGAGSPDKRVGNFGFRVALTLP